ncbi:Dyp-type peroxidase [Streptomyces aidingensis]|uniref:Dyp-type peroxidase family n=1 Tax=Streptomyces aidingensis TaxID=910347 RepID=A0A1I1M9L6_9ACTN|nr:Dyp-type peroxidase [Streptomyces aidingensis]SFC79878.1 Dyp-type peroxidase family [Streptomyces aidingensis]
MASSPARESSAAPLSAAPVAVPAQSAVEDAALPLRHNADIQGDILAGFRKDHVRLLLLRFANPTAARRWLARLRPRIATTQDVAVFNSRFSSARRRAAGADPADMAAIWRSIGFTWNGLVTLAGSPPITDIPHGSTQDAFVQGSARRAGLLGDTGRNAPENWLFGAPHHEPVDAVLTLAADRAEDLRAAVAWERQELNLHGVSLVFEQEGATLPGDARGHEHFGFKDGISQPAVQGFDEPDPENPEHKRGEPGTRMIPAGEFVVGLPMDHRLPAWLPDWMNNGSFQVIRRLAQDVSGWREQVTGHLAELKRRDAVPEDTEPGWLAARLVGRWPSGAPVLKHPDRDPLPNPALKPDNDLSYADDLEGRVTPLCAHLRKTSPRDGLKVAPGAPGTLPEKGVLDGRRIMRRGIPFGPPMDPEGVGGGPDTPRGLLFICYQSDLVAQFEFVQRNWVNDPDFPDRPQPAGRDMLIGRDSEVSFPAGGKESDRTVPLSFRQFVRTEGAVYTFVPSLSALDRLAQGTIPRGGAGPQDRVFRGPLTLRRFEVISSGRARLRLQPSGEFTVHDENERLLWRSGIHDGAETGEFRADGALVLHDRRGRVLWSTPTAGNPGAELVVRADGDVLIRAADGRRLWHTDTAH